MECTNFYMVFFSIIFTLLLRLAWDDRYLSQADLEIGASLLPQHSQVLRLQEQAATTIKFCNILTHRDAGQIQRGLKQTKVYTGKRLAGKFGMGMEEAGRR